MDMFNILSLIALFLVSFLFLQNILKRRNEPKNFPPGPRSYIPFIGDMLKIGEKPQLYFANLTKKWGGIFGFDMGPRRVVVFNDYKVIKEALSRVEFCGRTGHAFKYRRADINGDLGVLFNSTTQVWSDHRRFALKNLRDFGFGKGSIQNLMEVEIKDLLDHFKNAKENRVVIDKEFQASVMGALCSIVIGQRYELNDPKILNLYKRITEDFQVLLLVVFYPWLFALSKIFPSLVLGGQVARYLKNCEFALDFMKVHIEDHKISYQENSERDFIDVYLKEIQNQKDPNSSFYGKKGEQNLQTIMHELFVAGSETTSTTLSWVVHLLSIHTDIQEKVHDEIKSVIGLNRQPNLADRTKLPYTEACIFEIQRYGAVVPLVPHDITQDIKNFHGFDIPKGTLCLYNIYACLHDPEIWENPENFKPERFLSQDGTKTVKPDAFIPFFSGKRQCLGETLARDSLFLFTTSILQRFKISPDPQMKKIPKKVEFNTYGTQMPIAFPLIFKDRLD